MKYLCQLANAIWIIGFIYIRIIWVKICVNIRSSLSMSKNLFHNHHKNKTTINYKIAKTSLTTCNCTNVSLAVQFTTILWDTKEMPRKSNQRKIIIYIFRNKFEMHAVVSSLIYVLTKRIYCFYSYLY